MTLLEPLYAWCLFYLLPATAALLLKETQRTPLNRALIMHAGVATSIVLITAVAGPITFPFSLGVATIFFLVVIATVLVLGPLPGVGYILFGCIQEYCLLTAAFLIVPATGLWLAATLTSIVFTFAHRIRSSEWSWKFLLLFTWGVVSVWLYWWLRQPLLNISIHVFIGGLLIYFGLLYPSHRAGREYASYLRI